jgi:hypothetical protein
MAKNYKPHGRRPTGRQPKRWKDRWQSISQEQQQKSSIEQATCLQKEEEEEEA